ncbi:TRAP-type C4-dicarboxylate transport system periplasmic component [Vibrio variabilis]|uniref:TRAP-type C4-dicarboxylate transport system periplasmic component n=1 Tax=Vibrio variabilis TaxID=990271 RepID=A0ABQ0J7M3_9VIBR|nr:TRAP-type C4-dicarboxylate transport system periplasmic component [Vibrio variabilis]
MGSANAKVIYLSYNGTSDPEKNAVHLFATNLKSIVEKESNNEIEIKLYPNSILGKEQERMVQVLHFPSLNIASFTGVSALFPEIFVNSIPFAFDDFESARSYYDHGQCWKKLKEEFYSRNNAHLLAAIEEGGFLAFTNNKQEIRTPSDLKGLKFRAMDKSQVALYESLGATGTPIPWTEVYMALKMGVADGQINPPMYIIMGGLYEVQKYLTLANITHSVQFLIGNDELLVNLSEKHKEVLYRAIEKANEINRRSVESLASKRIDYLKKRGLVVYKPNKDEMDLFRNATNESYISWLKKLDIDENWIELALQDMK